MFLCFYAFMIFDFQGGLLENSIFTSANDL